MKKSVGPTTSNRPRLETFANTTRYLCPLPECDWTFDHKGPPNAETEAHLAAHVKAHRGEDWLREVMRLRNVIGNFYELDHVYAIQAGALEVMPELNDDDE